MSLDPREVKLGRALVGMKVLDEDQLAAAVANAEQWGHRLTEAIAGLRLVRESVLVDAIAEIVQAPKLDLKRFEPEPSALGLLDKEFCRKNGVLPFCLEDKGKTLLLGMTNPSNLDLIDLIAALKKVRVRPFVLGETVLKKAVQRFYEAQLQVRFDEGADEAPLSEAASEMKLVDMHGKTLMTMNPLLSAAINALGDTATLKGPAVSPLATSPPSLTPPPPSPPSPPTPASTVASAPSSAAPAPAPGPLSAPSSALPFAATLTPVAAVSAAPLTFSMEPAGPRPPPQQTPARPANGKTTQASPPRPQPWVPTAVLPGEAPRVDLGEELATLKRSHAHLEQVIGVLLDILQERQVVLRDELRARLSQRRRG